jgi:hypothetical protein
MSDDATIFATLRAANEHRQKHWDKEGGIDAAYRGNEMAGEIGEALAEAVDIILLAAAGGRACNIIKKIERARRGIRGSRATVGALAEELADVVICADLIAMAEGIDLDRAVAEKFNATSEKVDLPTRMVVPADGTPALAVTVPDGLHPQTRDLVGRFAEALAGKLRRAEEKYGYGDGWRTDDWEAKCRDDLRVHLGKGDPLDVAIYAAFMWERGWSTSGPDDRISLAELSRRGPDDDLVDKLNLMIGTPAAAVAQTLSREEMWALGHYGPPCECGERGLAPGETACTECGEEA